MTVPPSFQQILTERCYCTSLLEVVVTNATDAPLTVSDVSVNAPELLVGTYYIDFAGEITASSFESSGESYTSKIAKLEVMNGTALTKGQSSKFYLAVKPFTAAAGSKLDIYVNGYGKSITVQEAVAFAAGKIKTLIFHTIQQRLRVLRRLQ